MTGTTLPYVPPPEADELLHSWLARVTSLNQLGGTRSALSALFGRRHATPTVDFPVGLAALVHVTRGAGGSLTSMIEGRTLYPFYRPFANRFHHEVMRAMESGEARALWTRTGIAANGFGYAQQLKFCSECLRADLERCGFTYWHRAHHLPGVRVCHSHGCYLVAAFGLERRWHAKLTMPPRDRPEPIGCHLPWQLRFAQASADLLEASMPPLEPLRLQQTYLHALAERGYVQLASGRAKADLSAVATALRSHFGNFVGFTHKERLLRSERTPVQWVHALLRRPMNSSHPVCHMLMLTWLFGSVRHFQTAYGSSNVSSATCRQPTPVPVRVPVSTETLQEQRRLWAQMRSDLGGVRAGRDGGAAIYAWLYRNDREWLLDSNARARLAKPKVKSRVNWEVRDVALRLQASIAAYEMQVKTPNQRLTASRIYRILGETMVRRNAERLPALHQLVSVLAESKAEYHQRRILNALVGLSSGRGELTWSRLQRQAGLREWNSTLSKFAGECAADLGLEFRGR